MKLFRYPWAQVSDEEHVANIRRFIVAWDRWRFLLILMYLCLLAAVILVVFQVIPLLLGVAQPANAPIAGFITGTAVGLAVGWLFHQALLGLVFSFGGFRSERLLLKYHDGLSSEPQPMPRDRGW